MIKRQPAGITEKLTPRRAPYLWVTWLAGLLAGDKHCKWAPWMKAHYRDLTELEDPDENNLKVWKANHADMVCELEMELRRTWPEVRVEDQNKFNIQGRTGITIGGCADLVAVDYEVDVATVRHRKIVYDCKTGRKRDSDYWQVLEYMTFLPMADQSLSGISGMVAYKDGTTRDIPPLKIDDIRRKRILAMVTEIGSDREPRRVPSANECRFCRIACCPDRVKAQPGGFQRAITVEDF